MLSLWHGCARSLFVLFMAVTVVPWALAVLVLSIFVRGDPVYWLCVGWLRTAIWGAKVICGVHARLHGMRAPARRPAGAAAQTPVDLGDVRLPRPDAAPAGLCVQARAALHPVLRLGDGAHGHDPHRPQQTHRSLEQGRRAGPALAWPAATGSSCSPKARASPRGSQGTYKSGGTRLAVTTGAPVLPIAVTSARCWPRKIVHPAPGRDRRVDRHADPQHGPRARRADARGGNLDRGRDAAPRPRGLPARPRRRLSAADADDAPAPARPDARQLSLFDEAGAGVASVRAPGSAPPAAHPRPSAPGRHRRCSGAAARRRAGSNPPCSATRRPTARSACNEHLVGLCAQARAARAASASSSASKA